MKPTFENNAGIKLTAKEIRGFRGYPPMFHTHCELIIMIDGKMKMMVNGIRRELTSNDAVIVFPYEVHSYESSDEAVAYMVLFTPDMAGIFEGELMNKKPAEPFFENSAELFSLVKRLSELARDKGCGKQCRSYLEAALGEVLMTVKLTDAEGPDANMVKPILKYCSENYTDSNISIKSIADALYISRSYVSKVFSEKLGYGFRDYINTLRLDRAKKLLAHSDMKIIEIMLDCGYKNQSSFNRVFSESFGVSPREYRAKNNS